MKAGSNVAGAVIARFIQAIVERRCTVEPLEHDWRFDFGRGWVLEVAAAWRLVGPEGVIFADRDGDVDHLKTWPLGGDTAAGKALRRRKVTAAAVDPLAGDLTISFEGGLRLQVFNNSAAYEGWSAHIGLDGHNITLIGMAGGGIGFEGVAGAGEPAPERAEP